MTDAPWSYASLLSIQSTSLKNVINNPIHWLSSFVGVGKENVRLAHADALVDTKGFDVGSSYR